MDFDRGKVCIFIPTLNEAPTIGDMIRNFQNAGYSRIVVMDGHSTDGTIDIAEREGAEVHIQSSRGKGNAIIEGIALISCPYVLMVDGDGTPTWRRTPTGWFNPSLQDFITSSEIVPETFVLTAEPDR